MANYLNLITQAIGDFDRVWTALNSKGTVVDDFLVGKDYDASNVATSKYGDIIGKLSYVPGLSADANVAHFTTSDTKGIEKVSSVVKGSGVYTINTELTTAGYYDSKVKLTGQLEYRTANLTGNTEWVLSDGVYTLSANDYVIGGITTNQGIVTNSGEIGFVDGKAPSTTVTLSEQEGTTVTTVGATDTGFKVIVKADALTTATVRASVSNSVTEGYVTSADAAADWTDEQEIEKAGSNSLTLNIKAGSVKVQSVGTTEATASITSTTAGVLVSEADKDSKASYIELKSDIEGLSLEAEVTEGYVTTGKIGAVADDIKLGRGTKYIKIGSSNNQTVSLTAAELAVKAGSEYLEDGGKEVTIEIPASTTRTASIDPGYITSPGTITLSGTKTLSIKNGTGIAKSKISSYGLAKSDNTLKIYEADDDNSYSITVTPAVSVDTTGFAAGWIDSINTAGVGANNVASKTYYIGKGSVSVGDITFDASVTDRQDGLDGEVAIGDIFYTAAPDTGDYITINAGFSYSAVEGYIKSINATSPSVTKYLKKAVIERRESEDGTEEWFTVTQAGYLPSGTLKSISAFAPTPASVAIKVSGIGLATSTPANDQLKNYHTITVSKGLTNAGYISASEGTVSGTYYLQKGSVSTTTTLSATPDSTIARLTDNGSVSYRVRSSVTANAGRVVNEGYITEDEVSGTVTKTENVDYIVNRAVFGSTTHTTNASIAVADTIRVAEEGEKSAYTLTPQIDNCSTVFTVSTAGYISGDDTDILKFENSGTTHNGTMTPVSIHKGTGITDHSETYTEITASDDFATAEGNYTITIGGEVASAITLDTGYYGENEKTINETFSVSKTYTVNRGSATVTTSGTTSMTAAANGVVIHTEEQAGKSYYEIGATTTITPTKSSVTAGYIKNGDITVSGNSSTGVAYVEAYDTAAVRSTENPAPTGTTAFNVTIGQATADIAADTGKVLATAEKFNKKDISISLTANAMGSDVIDQFLALERRLAGTTAQTV